CEGGKMKTVILCGGLGTRLRQETEFRPKPLVEIGGRPILWHIMKIYAFHGCKDFVLCLGYKGEMIRQYFLNYQSMLSDFTISGLGPNPSIIYHNTHDEHDLCVTLADTGLETNTGGRIKRVQKYISDDPFMVTYGDGVADIDIRRLLQFHRSHGKLATLTTVRPVSRYGVIDITPDGKVKQFREKPYVDGWINAGFFVFSQGVFDYLDENCVLEREPLERLARDGQLAAFRHERFWYGMDTYRDFLYLNELWDNGEAPWRLWP
ncbi:glucose-1-phosphate cytidylyltransferase, partial [Candidatus Hakubella thermalkaliphila]